MGIPIVSAIIVGVLGIIFGVGLAIASRFLSVRSDEILERISSLLPNINCGACGFAGCIGYAQELIKNPELLGKCSAGGAGLQKRLAEILKTETDTIVEEQKARVFCKGDNTIVQRTGDYAGIKDCQSAVLVGGGGDKLCPYGCLGYGTCVYICPFGAIKMQDGGLPAIDANKCSGCGLCVKACPKKVIRLVPKSAYIFIDCSSKDKAARVRKYCNVGCIACGLCIKINNGIGISMKENLPVIDYKEFRGNKETAEKCPRKTISFG